ncbi:hypothetical protein AArcSl_0518 [Halalkaliarchaeum desulfuricum]|uniref:VIT family protein n=1 Tax=Halalkaliarchaeum desulfuricum TaxID=2055893 RepID=A0A343TGE7_9EURY|nr:hypothetical protein [Halalkaliarchaeum desulfuricum]AUX08169.1 hypothetical protein AArcSl_0518 [Halalkaliarchaeum desulfuricum]
MTATTSSARIRRVFKKDDVRSLARRYFIANSFDGVLTSLGVIIGAYLGGITDGLTVVGICLGAAVGLGTSGIWSVWEIERAETARERHELESTLLTSLEGTRYDRELRSEQFVLALAAATGPVLSIVFTLLPFPLEGIVFTMFQAVLVSIGLGMLWLGAIGAYMGHISQQRWYVSAIRMALAAIVVAVISIVLPG